MLVSHPEVLDAVAISYLDSAAGVVPIAYIVCSSNSLLNEVDVQKLIEAQVAPFKRLHQVTFFSSVLKSGSGKILRRELIGKVQAGYVLTKIT